MTASLRIAYAGTPEFAVPALKCLLDSHHECVCVITQPDRPAGRGRKISESAVKVLANEANVPIFQPQNINDEASMAYLRELRCDLMIVAAYGQLFKRPLLELPQYGCINIHASLLPRWRGASPIQHAILHGDDNSGVTIMQMAQKMDAGDIWYQSQCAIEAQDTAQSLHDRLATMGAECLLIAIGRVMDESSEAAMQDPQQVEYCGKLQKSDGLIEWSADAVHIDRQIRAFFPWPRAYTYLDGKRLGILSAQVQDCEHHSAAPGTVVRADKRGLWVATGHGCVSLQRVILEGGKAMSGQEFTCAYAVLDQRFGDQS